MAKRVYGTLAGTTVKTETIQAGYEQLEVVNRDAAEDLWVTVDGTDPVAEADDNYFVPAGTALTIGEGVIGGQATTVKLKGNSNKYGIGGSK